MKPLLTEVFLAAESILSILALISGLPDGIYSLPTKAMTPVVVYPEFFGLLFLPLLLILDVILDGLRSKLGQVIGVVSSIGILGSSVLVLSSNAVALSIFYVLAALMSIGSVVCGTLLMIRTGRNLKHT